MALSAPLYHAGARSIMTPPQDEAMRIASVGHVVFAATLVALGILGLVQGDLAPAWQAIPKGLPAREAVALLCAIVLLACGTGLLWPRTTARSACVLLAYLALKLLLLRLPEALHAPAVLGSWYGCAETLVVVAAAWAIYASFASEHDRRRFAFATGSNGSRIARALFGTALVFFGASHFAYANLTTPLVPAWLPGHLFWAWFFGCTYIAAGVAVSTGIFARLAAALATLQMGMFTLLVWVPMLAAGHMHAITGPSWKEFVASWTMTAAAWVVADACRGMPWFVAVPRRH